MPTLALFWLRKKLAQVQAPHPEVHKTAIPPKGVVEGLHSGQYSMHSVLICWKERAPIGAVEQSGVSPF